jgi:hypothetical protein
MGVLLTNHPRHGTESSCRICKFGIEPSWQGERVIQKALRWEKSAKKEQKNI